MSGKKSLSATNIAGYHHFNCDLFIYNTYHGIQDPKVRAHRPKGAMSLLEAAQLQRGQDWEACLFSWLDEKNLLLTVPAIPLRGRDLVENILADDRDRFFIAGISFFPPQERFDELYAKAGLDPVKFGLAKPDLVEITRLPEGIMWKVVDAKASRAVKTSHHVQIYFYTLCLEHLLPKDFFQPSNAAAVWLPPEDGFDKNSPSFDDLKTIETSLLSLPLNDFLFRRLPEILSLPRKDVFWHYNPLCHGCLFSKDCAQKSIDQGEIGSMSNISIAEAKLLQSLLHIWKDFGTATSTGVSDIEDLGLLLNDRAGMTEIGKSYPLTLRKARRVLSLPTKYRSSSRVAARSPVLEAARSMQIQIIPCKNTTCPRDEDIAVMLSLLLDPSAPSSVASIVSFSISCFAPSSFQSAIPSVQHGERALLIPSLAYIIHSILSLNLAHKKPPRTQFYIFSSAEHAALNRFLIDSALDSSYPTHEIRLCIGALSEGASLLQTTFQPLLLSGVLLEFLAKGTWKKADYQNILERMNLPTHGKIDELRARIQDGLQRLQKDDNRGVAERQRRNELGQLPRIVILKREIEKSLALPIPGFWDLPECVSLLCSQNSHKEPCLSDEELYSLYSEGGLPSHLLATRNRYIHSLLLAFRSRVSGADILLNDARFLTTTFMDICREEHLRKLFYMQQFEVLARLSELWRSRIDGCPEAPVLQYHHSQQGSKRLDHVFYLLSGSLDLAASDKERSFFDYILVEDRDFDSDESDSHIPVEALFDDLGVSGLVFPLTKYTKLRWQSQHPIVQNELLLADIRDISIDGLRTKVTLQTWGEATFKFSEGRIFRISPRLVDFNITKILSSLFELDLQNQFGTVDVPYIQIIRDPKAFNQQHASVSSRKTLEKASNVMQKTFRELDNLDVEAAPSLLLKPSQNRAARHIISNYLSVVWGPPGTGKTHTIALSLLRLFYVYANSIGDLEPNGLLPPKIVFVTAVTHAAIEAVLKKLSSLIKCYKSVDSLPSAWLDKVSIEHVTNGNQHSSPRASVDFSLYAGTIFQMQLYNFSKKHSILVDCIVMDEAGQMSLSSSALVLRCLRPSSRIIIAGDSEQLSPILVAKYPLLKSGPLFGSILDSLMYVSRPGDRVSGDTRPSTPILDDASDYSSSQGTIVQLTENFRLNPDLGAFVSTIYSRAFTSEKAQTRRIALALGSVSDPDNASNEDEYLRISRVVREFLLGLSSVMLKRPQNILSPPFIPHVAPKSKTKKIDPSDFVPRPISLALMRLQTTSKKHRENVGYELHVKAEAALAASLIATIRQQLPEEDIFVAVPHRIQRQAVKAALASERFGTGSLSELLGNMSLNDKNKAQPGTSTVTVDTVERLQGSEAAFVICLFSLPQSHIADLHFLLERRRLNVAISRAKSMCILISSNEVLRPAVSALTNEETAKGYTFLRAFADRAWSSDVTVDIDAL
ncbi:hypothetical protein D9757_000477 [Collybiopsis confluens]|uniref:DNA2/NAM7 helicase-like C-terminal domain-containing protein n=1 Tax=Collybiopsis confluens TaxID=2823264 RepID=A0A8H5I1K9_9AGAR|nr:hypothetical protein D9757_000477 [Collybiopsis confluens]